MLQVDGRLRAAARAEMERSGPEWLHEIKHDGYCLIARKRNGRARLFTRRGCDWTARYLLICEAVAAIPAPSVIIDGEAVYCDAAGVGARS
jgi:bifunctional non-homologous end joining protein LigD